MSFIADLHIHSRFSRATAKSLNFENLYLAARQKGITVVGTGDFTHPGWLAEIREQLVPAEPGLFRLADDLERACEKQLTCLPPRPVRFLLSSEISTIYKKDGATRKLHHLIFFSGIDDVARFNARLGQIGNLKSDGRPILGLDSRDLLEIVLDTARDGCLIPAHIWTPWFSLYGSKSGFDTIEQCFGDLSGHIFAAETGLSSDPPMNWRVEDLDRITLVSNSDAHSPANLGREANLFATELSYHAMFDALKTGDPEAFGGTLEFFPEEGKYHQDGHRKCGVNLHPEETLTHGGKCPACGHALTLGVLYRVEQLAGRPEGEKPERSHPFYSLIPLAEILSEIAGVGPKSKKVARLYQKALESLGPELDILLNIPENAIPTAGIPLLGEAIGRMRQNRVHVQAGYDGEYGRITIFTPDEREARIGQKSLFASTTPPKSGQPATPPPSAPPKPAGTAPRKCRPEKTVSRDVSPMVAGLNDAQMQAVTHPGGPLLIVAGPGTGKTRTLTCRIAWLLDQKIASPDQILAVTFTNKAAKEMAERLSALLNTPDRLPKVATFHAICFELLKEIAPGDARSIVDDADRKMLLASAMEQVEKTGTPVGKRRLEAISDSIAAAKQQLLAPEDDLTGAAGELDAVMLAAVYAAYQERLALERLHDYEDLILRVVRHLDADETLRQTLQNRFRFLFVDEYQDLNHAQYRLVRLLVPENGDICVIGDPDQSIYGFRGADASYFGAFSDDYPASTVIRLDRNYRSTETILSAAMQVISPNYGNALPDRIYSQIDGMPHVGWITAGTERGEAVAIGKAIERMIGGTGFDFHDFDRPKNARSGQRAFSDFAVLYRTRAQGELVADVLEKAGIPCRRANKEAVFGQKGICEPVSVLKLIEGGGTYPDLDRAAGVLAPEMPAEDYDTLTAWGNSRRLSASGLLAEADRLRIAGLGESGILHLKHLLTQLSELSQRIVERPIVGKLEFILKWLEAKGTTPSPSNEALEHLMSLAGDCGTDTQLFLDTVALQTDPDLAGHRGEKVALLTMHAAKGLEFPVVFVAGCEDGLIPFHRPGRRTDIEEERRLFYVALTRAEEELYLCSAQRRMLFGGTQDRQISPFLADIDRRLLRRFTDEAFRPKRKEVQLKLFS